MFEIGKVSEVLRKLSVDKTVVMVSGAFDLLHKGHVHFLNECKSMGDILVVGVRSDLLVSDKKGNTRPIISEEDRAYIVSNLKCVDFVFIIREPLSNGGMNLISPNKVIFCYEKDKDFSRYQKIIDKYKVNFPNIECVIFNRKSAGTETGTSTTKIINKILKNYES